MKKRLLSLLLIGCMLLPLLPALPMQAGAAAPTLGQIGSSTTLYDDIVLGETALPMTYQDFLAASVEEETPQTAYKKYLMETPSVTWKGDWSLGAMIDGEYEPIEYIVFMQGKTLESIQRQPVTAGDHVCFCIAEKTENNNEKLGIDPIVYTYESAEAASGTASQFTGTALDTRRTINQTAPLTYDAWRARRPAQPTEPLPTLTRSLLRAAVSLACRSMRMPQR